MSDFGGNSRKYSFGYTKIKPITTHLLDRANLRPITTYKYVDVYDAHYVQSGSLKIGTLAGYAKLEDETRRDAQEGVSHNIINGIKLREGDQLGIAAASAVGIIVNPEGESEIMIQACYGFDQTPPTYCFCLSRIADSFSLSSTAIPQALFQISDTLGLGYALREKYPDRFKSINFGYVQYTGRIRRDYEAGDGVPAWLRKEPRHAGDREFRMIWAAGDDAEFFITPADEDIARFFRRIV